MMSRHLTIGLLGLTLAACSATSASSATSAPAGPAHAASSRQATPTRQVSAGGVRRHPSKVLLIVEENHGQAAALAGMPGLRRLAGRYGRTTNYRAVTHPSLPNYLALAGGSTFGVRDDNPPASHPLGGRSVFDQTLARGGTARVYAESMPGRCALVSSGEYGVKHNPWAYFGSGRPRANCRRHDVPLGSLRSGALHHDVVHGRLPTVGMVVPNLCDDAHSCPLSTADRWLRGWMSLIRNGRDWRSGRLAVVVTFDENEGSSPNTVLTVVASRRTHHVVDRRRYSHYSWTRYADSLTGARPLRHARQARSLRRGFHL